MELNLSRPIIFFDIEATGLSISQSRIVELSLLKVYPKGQQTESRTNRFNPTIHIEEQASEVNGIYDEDVADCPTFKEKAAEVAEFFKGCDIAGYNSNHFDVPLLVEEMLRAGIDFDLSESNFIDVQTIFHKMEQRTLSAAYKFYCNKNLEDAHTAEADTNATYEVLKAQLDRYSDTLENNVTFLSKFTTVSNNIDFAGRFSYDEKGVEVFNFGKFKGKPVAWVLRTEPGYYAWMMQGDFPQNTKQVLTKIRLKNGL